MSGKERARIFGREPVAWHRSSSSESYRFHFLLAQRASDEFVS